MLRAVILIATFIAVKGDGCVQRSFGPNAIVCVCNATYCDTINEPPLAANEFQWYVSSEDGQRLQLSVYNFSPKVENISLRLVLTVDSSQKYQTIHGFGGAMTDSTALNIRTLSNATQNNLLKAYFGYTGIGYTHCRIPIAGTDFSTRAYTYDDVPDDVELRYFSLAEEDYYKTGYIDYIKSIMPNPNELRIFTTAWSAPAWMKESDSLQGGSNLIGSLKREYYQLYADYIRKFFDAYKELGIDIWGMTPGNEPLDGLLPSFPFNAMLWLPSTEAEWSVNNLAPTLSNAGYNKIVYMALDDQRYELPWWVDIMFQNQQAKELFNGTAVHWYADKLFSPMRLTETQMKYPDKFILMTEACTGSSVFEKIKVKLGSWDRGESYLSDIIQNLSHWVTGWIDWNMALNEHGGPNWAKNFVDSPIIVIPRDDEFYKQPMFYAIAHISKFVPRHSYRIDSTGLENSTDVKTIAFLTPENKIVVIALNESPNPVDITIRDKNTNSTMDLRLSAKSFNTVLYLEQQ